MINKDIKKYCKDYHLIENYDKAVADETQVWDLHHRAETDENLAHKQLKEQGRYFNCEPSELIFLTHSEHTQLHYDSELGEEAKRKIGEANKGKNKGRRSPNYGKPMSDEQKLKISNSLKGRVLSDETKRKMSNSLKGEKNPNYGKPMSDEQKQKLSNAHKGKSLSEAHRRKLSEVRKGKPSVHKGKHWKLVDGKRVWY